MSPELLFAKTNTSFVCLVSFVSSANAIKCNVTFDVCVSIHSIYILYIFTPYVLKDVS